MPEPFRTVGIIGKYTDPNAGDTLVQLRDYLQARAFQLRLDEATAEVFPLEGIETVSRDALGATCDLVVVVGGDGTLLDAARSLADHQVALLGVNLGRLGFLVDVSPEDMLTRLEEVLAGQYREESRFLLQAEVYRDGARVSEGKALNEVVVHKWEVARMIELETFVDDQFVNRHRSDGLIVATPTGSTAYAMSSGGPVVHPQLDALVLVPVCPHTLSNRPVVVGADSRVDIVVGHGTETSVRVTCDGHANYALVPGDRVSITRYAHGIRLIHPAHYDYFRILRAKLLWGETADKREKRTENRGKSKEDR